MIARSLTLMTAIAAALTLAACGGGNDDGARAQATGTMRLALTDAPACGFDHAYVTVEKLRVHRDADAGEAAEGWSELVLDPPRRVDLLTLTNGVLEPLGEMPLPAGRYTQLRLVLAANTPLQPLANAVVPAGSGTERPLTTPSGQPSGLKVNAQMDVPPGRVVDFAIDFDACKSFVRAGASGRILLKPVLSVIPIESDAGLRIVGFVVPALAAGTTTVSAQAGGVPVRATPPDADGRFVLYPVPAGDYELVITAPGHVNAVMSGVPVTTTAPTTIGSAALRIDVPASAGSAEVEGVITVGGDASGTDGVITALQTVGAGVAVEVGHARADDDGGGYRLRLPTAAPVQAAYAVGAQAFVFAPLTDAAGRYELRATVPGAAAQEVQVVLDDGDVVDLDFAFVSP